MSYLERLKHVHEMYQIEFDKLAKVANNLINFESTRLFKLILKSSI